MDVSSRERYRGAIESLPDSHLSKNRCVRIDACISSLVVGNCRPHREEISWSSSADPTNQRMAVGFPIPKPPDFGTFRSGCVIPTIVLWLLLVLVLVMMTRTTAPGTTRRRCFPVPRRDSRSWGSNGFRRLGRFGPTPIRSIRGSTTTATTTLLLLLSSSSWRHLPPSDRGSSSNRRGFRSPDRPGPLPPPGRESPRGRRIPETDRYHRHYRPPSTGSISEGVSSAAIPSPRRPPHPATFRAGPSFPFPSDPLVRDRPCGCDRRPPWRRPIPAARPASVPLGSRHRFRTNQHRPPHPRDPVVVVPTAGKTFRSTANSSISRTVSLFICMSIYFCVSLLQVLLRQNFKVRTKRELRGPLYRKICEEHKLFLFFLQKNDAFEKK